jgi:hypothetical protein
VKVVFATPSLGGPTAPYIKALEASIPLIIGAGWEEGYAQELGNPYISAARALMTRRALDAGADVIVYLDYDLSWDPGDLLKLLQTEGDVVAGTYRYKKDEEAYMGVLAPSLDGRPTVRADGAIKAEWIPAGFLKVTKLAICALMKKFPELMYGDPTKPHFDLFNHGVRNWTWYGEDYAFSRRWGEVGGDIWIVPDLNLNHHSIGYSPKGERFEKVFPGNFHRFLLRQPGGSESSNPQRFGPLREAA